MARQDGSSHWVADRRVAGNRSLLSPAPGSAWPRSSRAPSSGRPFPGASSVPLLDPTEIGDEPSRETVSPLVDIRSRLVAAGRRSRCSGCESPVRSYWRLTSLEEFDGRDLVVERQLRVGRRRAPAVGGDVRGRRGVRADVHDLVPRRDLAPERLRATGPRRRRRRGPLRRGVRHAHRRQRHHHQRRAHLPGDVPCRLASPPRTCRAPPTRSPADIRDDFLDLPEGFSPQVQRAGGARIVADAATPADQARALQDYLRTFTYSLEAQPGHSENALEDFLFVNQVGYCEQFAGAFAAMARSVGVAVARGRRLHARRGGPGRPRHLHRARRVRPRVARGVHRRRRVGAPTSPPPTAAPRTPSRTRACDEQQARGRRRRSGGRRAHHRDDRGHPADATGPSPDVREPRDRASSPATRTAARRLAVGLRAGPLRGPADPPRDPGRARPRWSPTWCCSRSGWRCAGVGDGAGRRRRLEQVQLAWTESVESAAIAGFEERASDTYVERALRLGQAVPEAADPALTLAARLEVGSYSAEGAGPDDATVAWEAAGAIGEAATGAGHRQGAAAALVRPPLAAAIVAAGPGGPPAPHHADATRRPRGRARAGRLRRPRLSVRCGSAWRYSSSAWRKRSRIRPFAPPMASRKPVALRERVTCSKPALPSLRRLRSK